MAAHRYWRVRAPTTYASGYFAITDLEMRSGAAGADQTVGKTATASADAGATYAPDKAIDADLNSFWTTGGAAPPTGGHWLAVDFGTPVDVTHVALKSRVDSYREDPSSLELQYSDNGVSYSTQNSVTGIPAWTAGETRTFDLTMPAPGGNARVSQMHFESLIVPPAKALVSQLQGEALIVGPTKAVVSQLQGEALIVGPTKAVVSQLFVEVLRTVALDPNAPVAPGHRYWRLLVLGNASGSYASMSELKAFASADGSGPNLLTGGTASSSTTYADPPSVLFDDNINTWWATSGGVANEWVRYDLGQDAQKEIGSFSITGRNDQYSNQTPTSGKWQYSDDAATWTTALDWSTQTPFGAGQTQTFAVPPPAGAARRRRAVVC